MQNFYAFDFDILRLTKTKDTQMSVLFRFGDPSAHLPPKARRALDSGSHSPPKPSGSSLTSGWAREYSPTAKFPGTQQCVFFHSPVALPPISPPKTHCIFDKGSQKMI